MAKRLSELTKNNLHTLIDRGVGPSMISRVLGVSIATVYTYSDPEYKAKKLECVLRWRKEHPDYMHDWYEENKSLYAARRRLRVGTTKDGKVVSGLSRRQLPPACELCGENYRRLVYHHWSDDNLNDGIWTCTKCHRFCEAVDQGLLQYLGTYQSLKAAIDGGNGHH